MRSRRNRVWHYASLYLAMIGASLILQQGAHATTTIRPLSSSTNVVRYTHAVNKTVARKPMTTTRRPVVAVKRPVARAPQISGRANHILISMRAGRRLTAAQLRQLSSLAGQNLRVESNQGHGEYMLRTARMLPYATVQTMSARLKRNTNLLDAVPTQVGSTKYMVVKAGHPITLNGSSIAPNSVSAVRYHWTQIRGRAVRLNSVSHPVAAFLAPRRIVRQNAPATCDPNTDPTCTSTAADPSLTCDPSIDPTCGTTSSPSAVCDPTVDPTCSGSPASSNPSLVCDPTSDPTCGSSSPSATCDPTVDPTCSGSSPSATCDPTVDPTCSGSSPSASCDPTVDPTCNSSPSTIPGASTPIGSCGSTITNSIRRASVNGQLRKNSLFGGSTGGMGGLGGLGNLLGGMQMPNIGNMMGGMQPLDATGSSSNPTGSSNGIDPTTGLPTGSTGSAPSGSAPSSGSPFGSNLFGGGLFGQIMQDINQLFVDINSFMCSLQSGMSNMGGSNGGSNSGMTGQAVRGRRVVRDNANVLGFRLMTRDAAGHNIMHRVYVHVVPNVITRKSVGARKPVAAARKPATAIRRPATAVRKPVAVTRKPFTVSRKPL